MNPPSNRIELKRTFSMGNKNLNQPHLSKAWFTRLSIESLYASLLKPQVEISNPALVSFIRAEGLPELVSDGSPIDDTDEIVDYVELHLKYVNKFSYSSEMAKLVQDKGIKVNKLWFVMSDYNKDSAKIITNLNSFISKCSIQSIGFDFILCSEENYSKEMRNMLDMIDQALETVDKHFRNLNSNSSSALPTFFSAGNTKPIITPTTNRLSDHYNLEDPSLPISRFNLLSLEESTNSISPTSNIGEYQSMLMSSCPAFNSDEFPFISRSASILSSPSQQTPTPLTSPGINIRMNPFESQDQMEIPRSSITIANLSRRRSLMREFKVENLCFKTLDRELLKSCLLYTPLWSLKTITIQAQNDPKSLEDSIEGNSDLIQGLLSTKTLPRIIINFKHGKEYNENVFELDTHNMLARINQVRSIYPSLSFSFSLNSVFFTTPGYAKRIEIIMKHLKYSDIKMIIQDVRKPILDYNTSIRNWRQIIALLENLETVKYFAQIDLTGSIMFDSWSSANWMWELYTKLKKMTFQFELVNEKSDNSDFNQLIIEVPQHVKRLNIDLILTEGDGLKEFNIADKIAMKGTFLAQLNITLTCNKSQSSIKLLMDQLDNPVKKLTIKSNVEVKVEIQTSKPLFDHIITHNCQTTIS